MMASTDLDQARRDVIDASLRLHEAGLVTGTSGNVSCRVGDVIVITPSGVAYAELVPADLPTVGLDGQVLSTGTSPPSSEVPLHLGIYRTTAAHAVVHTHSPWATALGLVRDELPAVHYAIRALGGPVRVADYATFGSAQLAEHVTTALDGRRAVLMRNHGAVTVGDSVGQAMEHTEKLEWLCELYCRAARLGEPATLTTEQLDDVRQQAEITGYRP
jgi:L-fuculose-phosphate aldolase